MSYLQHFCQKIQTGLSPTNITAKKGVVAPTILRGQYRLQVTSIKHRSCADRLFFNDAVFEQHVEMQTDKQDEHKNDVNHTQNYSTLKTSGSI